MSIQLNSIALEKTEPLTVIKNEPPESDIWEIGMDNILDSSESEEKIVPDVKDIDIVYHPLCEHSVQNETIPQVFVKTENASFVKIENINENLNKTEDTGDRNVNEDIEQGLVEVQDSNKQFNILDSLETNEQLALNFSSDLNGISVRSRKAKFPEKTDFAECYEIIETTSWGKEKEKIKVIIAPVIPVKTHEYTSLAKDKHLCNHCQHAFNSFYNVKQHIEKIHRKVTTIYQCPYCPYKSKWSLQGHIIQKHKDPQDIQWFQCHLCEKKFKLKYQLTKHIKVHLRHEQIQNSKGFLRTSSAKCHMRFVDNKEERNKEKRKCHIKTTHEKRFHCDECKYKTDKYNTLKRHKLIHLKPEDIQYFYCYHCSYKSKRKDYLIGHIFGHFKKEEIKFHCYICNFVTLKRDLIVEHIRNHFKHDSKCDKAKYIKYQRKIHTKKHEKRYCCEKCGHISRKNSQFKLHKLSHKRKADMDDRDLKYRCDKCIFNTHRYDSFRMHKLIHLKPEESQYFYCHHCSYKSKRKTDLKTHIFRHFKSKKVKDAKSYLCDQCGFKTFTRYDLKKHKLMHLKPEEIPYFHCYHCSYKSKRKDHTRAHIFRHFKNEEIKFHCYICNFMTLKREAVIEHIKKHSKLQIKSEINEDS